MTRSSSSKFNLKTLLSSKLFWVLLTFIFTIPAFAFLLRPGIYYNMHDDMQMIRQLEMDKCLHDGQIPCRWTPDLGYGYGYPLFNFYPPLPYFVGQVFRTLTFNYMDSVKLMAVAQIVLASLFMFILASSLWGNLGGFISALFYTYAPYHALNVYIRGAFNEAWASVFFPLNLYFSKKLIETKKPIYLVGLAISFASTMLSHNPMVLTFAPILVVWCLYWIFTAHPLNIKKIKYQSYLPVFLKLIISAVLAVALAAFYFLPVVFETKFVKIDTMFEGYYNFGVHFTSLRQLFISNFWGDGASVWGQNDDMSFMIGYIHWIVPLLVSIYLLFKLIKRRFNKTDLLVSLIIGMGLFAAFMTHERSAFIWVILTPIQKIQFPWRFLNHVIFLMSLASGSLALYLSQSLPKKSQKILYLFSALSIIVLLVLNIKYFTPLHYGPLTDDQKFSGKAWINQVTSGIYDYLPKTAQIAPQSAANFPVDNVNPKDSSTISSFKHGTDWFLVNLNVSQESEVTLSQMYFPEFKISDNDKPIDFTLEPTLGRMVVKLSPGNHQLYVKLNNTPVRLAGNYISSIAWILVLIYLISQRWPHKRKSTK